MVRRHSRRNWGRRWGWGAGGAAALVLVVGAGLWLAFQRIPSWYVPVEVPQAELSRVRNSLPNAFQQLSDRAIENEPFTFTLTARQVTEWIVARAELYPDARDWLPDWLRDPVVVFEDDRCIVAARVDYQGWQTIVGIHLVADITPETVTIRVDGVTGGALPVPLGQLAEPLGKFLRSARLDVEVLPDPVANIVNQLREGDAVEALRRGVHWPNLFELRNGRKLLKVRGASAADGVLRVELEPR